jgi:hypothetical protein
MAAIDFPNSPAVNDTFTAGTASYKWTGTAWISNNLGSVEWTSVVNKPATFAPSAHTHATSEVTGLDSALSGKAATVHTHTISQITDYVPPVITYSDTFMLMGA